MIDKTKLSLQDQASLETYQQNEAQLKTLEDIANIVQDISSNVNDSVNDKKSLKALQDLGILLLDMRESLQSLDKKEAPEQEGFSQPVIVAIAKLEKALSASLKAIDVKPQVNVSAPQVNVDAPIVDLSGVKDVLKNDIPKAFQKAIDSIPKTEIPKNDNTQLVDKLAEAIDWLQSIDTASRLKPQFPTQLKVTNPDGTIVGYSTSTFATKITVSGSDTYVGEATPGSSQASTVWRIQKIDSDGNITWKDGNANFDNSATDLTTGSFS